jgi:hypothetical protein
VSLTSSTEIEFPAMSTSFPNMTTFKLIIIG